MSGVQKMIGKGIVLIFLAAGTVWDLKKKALPENYVFLFGVVAMLYLVFQIISGKSISEGVLGLIPGVVSLILCLITKEQIGLGDGLLLLFVGCFQNMKETLAILFAAFAILLIVSMFLLFTGQVGRKSTIPFVPFLFCGQFLLIVGGFL